MAHTMALDEAARHSVAEIVTRILRDRRPVCINAPVGAGAEMRISEAGPKLEPIETLSGIEAIRWKDAVYGPRS